MIYHFRSDLESLLEGVESSENKRLLAACEGCKDVANDFPKEERSDILCQIAEHLIEDQKSGAAIVLYLMVITEKASDEIWLSLGRILLKNEVILPALLCFIQTDCPESGILTADVIRLLGWPDQALVHLGDIKPKPPYDLLWHLKRSDALAGSGRYTDAVYEIEPLLNGEVNEILFRYVRFAAAAGDGNRVQSVLPLIITALIPPEAEKLFTSISEQIWSLDNRKGMPFCSQLRELSKGEANLFLLQCILAYGQTPENCLKKISLFSARSGATNETIWKVIAGYSYEEWCSFPKSDWLHTMKGKHGQVHRMATALIRDAAGDARGLWTGATEGELLRRLDEIGIAVDSINLVIIAMVNSGLPGNDAAIWNPDPHVRRIIARMLFGVLTLPEEVIPFIQQIFGKYGHILNRIAKWSCHIKNPLCSNCSIHDFCTWYDFYPETHPYENWDDRYIQDSWFCLEEGIPLIRIGDPIQIAGIDQIFSVGRKFLYHYDRYILHEIGIFEDIFTNYPSVFRNLLNIRVVGKGKKSRM
ncbi:MAG: hypothetical protein JXA44_08685 [Methanospirillaceae archaeon]|nr:hypothetical protein [Methanospirillaceae archaeon]